MSLRLRDGVSWCLCAGHAVFLDLERDRFFCLPPDRDAAFRSWAEGVELPAAVSLEPLRQCGLLVPDEHGGTQTAPVTLIQATRDLAAEPTSAPTPRDVLAAAFAQYRATRLLRRRPLHEILAKSLSLGSPQASQDSDSSARAHRLAAAFAATSIVLRTADQCLPRAIAMRRLCLRIGVAPMLVLGVRRDPFAAHCWVQLGDAVLVGDLGQARTFTPILVVP